MMRFLWLLVFLATPATAQDRMTQTECADSLTSVAALSQLDVSQIPVTVDAQGWCEVADATIPAPSRNTVHIGSLKWRGSDMGRFVVDGLPPRAIDVEVRDFRILTETGDAVLDYLIALQSVDQALDAGLSLRWDGVQKAVILDRMFVDLYADNRIEATARIDGIDLTDRATINTSLGTAGLSNLIITSEFDGWFEAFVMMTLGSMFLYDSDAPPEAQVATLKGHGIEIVQELPDDLMPATSRDALSAFIAALPTPRGTVRLQMSATTPIGAANLAPVLLTGQAPSPSEAISRFMKDATILFTWTPEDGTP